LTAVKKRSAACDLPSAASIASPLAVRVSRERAGADVVPVVDDVDPREVLADVRNELGAVKRQLARQTEAMKLERDENARALAAVQLEVASAKKDASVAAENLDASVRQLNGAKRQLHQLTEKIEREQQQQAVNNVLREGREGAKSATAEQLQRHVEHLTSELERERRLAVARSIKRGPASTEKQTQAGSGVTSSQFYRTKNCDVGVTCDVMSLAEYGDALKSARDATTTLKALQASLGTDTVELAHESSQLKQENEELQRQVAAYKAQISEKAGDAMRINRELTAAKKQIEALAAQQQQQQQQSAPAVLASPVAPTTTMDALDEATAKELTALWVEAKLLGASGGRAADGAIDHAKYARELARRLASAAAGTSTPPIQARRTSDASSTASSQRQLGPLRGAPRRESGAGKLATKSARPFDDR
jgi:seryl-tRNA synthetase